MKRRRGIREKIAAHHLIFNHSARYVARIYSNLRN
jgi:hypothetical protein